MAGRANAAEQDAMARRGRGRRHARLDNELRPSSTTSSTMLSSSPAPAAAASPAAPVPPALAAALPAGAERYVPAHVQDAAAAAKLQEATETPRFLLFLDVHGVLTALSGAAGVLQQRRSC